ncbi:hypothetical protein Ait01nite_087620 [Actinoplanes italicus]|uniref:Uncharacterized protein n=1 Tax=Actinoplanes italicus TaxID=113567 RepID=A0A2T0K4A9_9ACTN|nr:hypothetical protein [Actinoplanes italicus]PRX17711.1 hypothetical protein CLV67_115214 [Actinoplanes italicus]GIE35717.1 hypothetical protein Ait01nite_087620 [Actinoplanes italicus]
MPVSRKRKKSPKSAAAVRADRRRDNIRRIRSENAFRDLASSWEQSRIMRTELARPHAAELAERLLASPRTGTALEDELCASLGPVLAALGDLPSDGGYVGPDHLAAALAGDLAARDGEAAARVLAALAAILPLPLLDRLKLRAPERTVAGEVLWTCDRYGSRFAVIAPFGTPEGPVRWYLWDLDACDFAPTPVHTAFYASPEEALAAWQLAVGAVAAGGTSWRRIDDSHLLEDLLPVPQEIAAMGVETAEQLGEYHRCRSLAESVLELPPVIRAKVRGTALDAGSAAFAAWWRDRADRPEPEDLDDLIEDLFEAWPVLAPSLFDTCSPHRVEAAAGRIRDEYLGDQAALLALLRDWVTWLAERSGLQADLLDRSLARIGTDPGTRSPIARVIE